MYALNLRGARGDGAEKFYSTVISPVEIILTAFIQP